MPQAGEGPGSGVLERRRPIAVNVARPHRLIEESFGLQGGDDPATQRFGCAGVAGSQIDDLQAARVGAVGQHHETVTRPHLVLGFILGQRDLGLDLLKVRSLEVRPQQALAHVALHAAPGQQQFDLLPQVAGLAYAPDQGAWV